MKCESTIPSRTGVETVPTVHQSPASRGDVPVLQTAAPPPPPPVQLNPPPPAPFYQTPSQVRWVQPWYPMSEPFLPCVCLPRPCPLPQNILPNPHNDRMNCRQIRGHGIEIWGPVPGMATHFNTGLQFESYQSPYTNWVDFGRKILRTTVNNYPPIPNWRAVLRELAYV